MKKMITLLLIAAMVCAFAVPVMASPELTIVRQMQHSTHQKNALAEYEIKAYGTNVRCTWYLEYEGKTYDISDTSMGIQPWEPYAGETYGDLEPEVNGNFFTFRYFFGEIGKKLDGAKIYAVITDGHNEITSQKSYIQVVDSAGAPPKIMVSASMTVYQGEPLDLYCEAYDPDGGTLSYLWYETSNGALESIIAINRGSEDKDTLHVDTSTTGTRYYVCSVATSNGGGAYSSVIPVTVFEKSSIPVQFTADSYSLVGHFMTVDIDAMKDQDARIWNAWLEKTVQYQWYLDGQSISGGTETLNLTEDMLGKMVHVAVTCDDLVLLCQPFEVSAEEPSFAITTEILPEGKVGEAYSAQLEANNADAYFEDWAVHTDGVELSSIGLSISAEGKITGTPTKAGTHTITIHASWAGGEAEKTFTLTIAEAESQPTQPSEPTELTDPTDETKPTKPATDGTDEKDTQEKNGMPWWGILLIALGAAGAGVAVTVILMKKKK